MNTDKAYAEKIASEYAPKETRKVVALRKLDNRAKLPANIFADTFGVVAALLLGVGMCLSMKVLGDGSALFTALGAAAGPPASRASGREANTKRPPAGKARGGSSARREDHSSSKAPV